MKQSRAEAQRAQAAGRMADELVECKRLLAELKAIVEALRDELCSPSECAELKALLKPDEKASKK